MMLPSTTPTAEARPTEARPLPVLTPLPTDDPVVPKASAAERRTVSWDGYLSTEGWTDEAIHLALETVKGPLRLEDASENARKWWTALLKENEDLGRLGDVLVFAHEIVRRELTAEEFFLGYVYSNCDGTYPCLAYTEYREFGVFRAARSNTLPVLPPGLAGTMELACHAIREQYHDRVRLLQSLAGLSRAISDELGRSCAVDLAEVAARISAASFGILSARGALAWLTARLPAESGNARDALAATVRSSAEVLPGASALTPTTGIGVGYDPPLVGPCELCGRWSTLALAAPSEGQGVPSCTDCLPCKELIPAAHLEQAVEWRNEALRREAAAEEDARKREAPRESTTTSSPEFRLRPREEPAPVLLLPGVSDTADWDVDRLLTRLQEMKDRLKFERASPLALAWWKAFELENQDHLRLVLRVAEEAALRMNTLQTLYEAHLASETDNIQSVVCYAQFRTTAAQHRKQKEGGVPAACSDDRLLPCRTTPGYAATGFGNIRQRWFSGLCHSLRRRFSRSGRTEPLTMSPNSPCSLASFSNSCHQPEPSRKSVNVAPIGQYSQLQRSAWAVCPHSCARTSLVLGQEDPPAEVRRATSERRPPITSTGNSREAGCWDCSRRMHSATSQPMAMTCADQAIQVPCQKGRGQRLSASRREVA